MHQWLDEDIPYVDIAGYVVGDKLNTASLLEFLCTVLTESSFVGEITGSFCGQAIL